ncbi:MAG: NUDIX domain-containing protein [Flavobacteriales bacterium]|nr:NUDIX domain-containing protein [Flavobacteriales bacterium]
MKSYPLRLLEDDVYSIPIDAFFKSAFSVDCAIFGYHDRDLKILLIQRGAAPYENFWALPGDLVYPDEDLDGAATRVLKDLTSLTDIPIRQVRTFGQVNRHPLGRVITVAYLALVEPTDLAPQASSWAKSTKWHSLNEVPSLAFDHSEILQESLGTLKNRLLTEDIFSNVLPQKFTLTEFQALFETILEKEFDKGNFRKKLVQFKFLKKLTESQKNVSHRPSSLYSFDEKKFNKMTEKGFAFDF